MSKDGIGAKSKAALPLEPMQAILDAFQAYRLVAIGEGVGHGDERGHAFLRALISGPRFADTVNDIIVECGNALYQDLMDQFLQGGDVPDDTLCQVWQNTTQPHCVWDKTVDEELFRTVRNVNQSLPEEKKLRVLLGDPPIDWSTIHTTQDLLDFFHDKKMGRDTYPADLIQREVLVKQRRALIVYGGMHLQRKNIFTNYEECVKHADPLAKQLESAGEKVFTIWGAADLEKMQADISSWPIDTLTMLQGTSLGQVDFATYYPHVTERHVFRDGKIISLSRSKWDTLCMEDQFDAVMYCGPSSSITYSQLQPATCSDSYIKMRIERMRLSVFPQSEIDRLRLYYHEVQSRAKDY